MADGSPDGGRLSTPVKREPGMHFAGGYTEHVLAGSVRYRRLLWIALGVTAVAAVAIWWLWRQKQDARSLFRRLPGEALLLLRLDVERVRRAGALAPLIRAQVDPDPDYAAFVKQTGFDYQRDLDEAAVCYLTDRVYVLARGRFDREKLRRYVLEQGGSCAGSNLERPCRLPASQPNRQISFVLIGGQVLALATAPEPEAVLQLQSAPASSAEALAAAASAMDGSSALLWATATPGGLEKAMSGSSSVPSNVTLFSRALANAQRVYFFLHDRSPNLEISLRAVCSSETQAGELRRLLQGLNDFIGGLLRGAPRGKPASDWERVLASASIDQEQNVVKAAWTLDRRLLENLGGAEPAR